MKNCQSRGHLHHFRVVIAVAAMTMLGLPVNAATSFPSYPLITGGTSIPPNILLILDDSGSMEATIMRADGGSDDSTSLQDSVRERSYVNNTLYYNPAKTYLPWRTASVDLNDRLAQADFRSVASNRTNTTQNKIDLRDYESETYFYVPKVANPGTVASNYDKYRITSSSSGVSYNGGVVQIRQSTNLVGPTAINSINQGNWSNCIVVNTNGAASVQIETSGGSGDGDLYVFYKRSDCTNDYFVSQGSNNDESVTVQSPQAIISFRIYAYSKVKDIVYTAKTSNWVDMTPKGNTSALQKAELQNFANWYQYHRSRNKMAKAGASEAFGRIGKNYRVGFDSIWNRGGDGGNVWGSSPVLPIKPATNGGLFEGTNRSNFYDYLQGAGADSSTPLKGALQRAARYFSTDTPWNDGNGNRLTCRQNYALLTSDGYWNHDSGYTSVGNADASGSRDVNGNPPQYPDSYSDTLADVAYKYWSEDLKPGAGWPNNVRISSANPAVWQHMVTFGISIGLRGTLDPSLPPPSPWDVNPNTGGEGPKRIDDLWHAALNGRGSFVVAADTDRFASALEAALATIDSRSASGSSVASSSTKTDTSTYTFVAGFTSGSWLGDLIASPFNAALTGVSNQALWTLSKTFAAGQVNANFANRTVLTSKGGTAALFNGSVAGSSDFNVRSGQPDAVTAADNILYLRGNQSKEIGKPGGTLRARAYPIGDIVHSSPTYVQDTNTVYIGANDGMLHAINAATGQVLFSYVPRGIDFSAMANLSSVNYDHQFFVDGQIDVATIPGNGSNKTNVLVAALGRGGRGVFGLDVTNPTSMGTSDVKWDQTGSAADDDMGYVLGAVRVRRGNGGKNYALVPNGIESNTGSATLFAYELSSTGAINATHKLVADAGSGNGLMSLGMADLNADGLLDVVYGGDLKGNIWRWDFSGSTPGAAVKLFQAKDAAGNAQPVTGGIAVGRHPVSNKVFVGFGTGRFISSNDVPGVATQTTQSFYGIEDTQALITGRSQLQQRTIPFTGTTASGKVARGFEAYAPLGSGKRGWFIDLGVPERVISSPTMYGEAMFVSSVIPAVGDDCQGVTGSGFMNAINLFTGTSPSGGRGYFNTPGTVTNAAGEVGKIGSIGITGGMPTEINVTSALATVGTGAFSSEGAGNTESEGIGGGSSGPPRRIRWREVVPAQ